MDREGGLARVRLPRVARAVAIAALALSAADMGRRAWLRAAEQPFAARLEALALDDESSLQRAAPSSLAVARAVHRLVPDASHLIVCHDGSREARVTGAFLPALAFPHPPRVYEVSVPVLDSPALRSLAGRVCLVRLTAGTPPDVAPGFRRVGQRPGFEVFVWEGG